jgi:hypothetical protein
VHLPGLYLFLFSFSHADSVLQNIIATYPCGAHLGCLVLLLGNMVRARFFLIPYSPLLTIVSRCLVLHAFFAFFFCISCTLLPPLSHTSRDAALGRLQSCPDLVLLDRSYFALISVVFWTCTKLQSLTAWEKCCPKTQFLTISILLCYVTWCGDLVWCNSPVFLSLYIPEQSICDLRFIAKHASIRLLQMKGKPVSTHYRIT